MQKKYSLKSFFFLFFALTISFEGLAQKNTYAGIEIGSKGIKISVIDVTISKREITTLSLFGQKMSV